MTDVASRSTPRLLPLGDRAFTLAFGAAVDAALHARVRGFVAALAAEAAAGALPGVTEWLPAFASVTVFFDPDVADPDALAAHLLDGRAKMRLVVHIRLATAGAATKERPRAECVLGGGVTRRSAKVADRGPAGPQER